MINNLTPTTTVGTQTTINGITVSKSLEVINILSDVLPQENTDQILEGVNKIVKNITD